MTIESKYAIAMASFTTDEQQNQTNPKFKFKFKFVGKFVTYKI